jgi:hypothetical protein
MFIVGGIMISRPGVRIGFRPVSNPVVTAI